MHKAILAIQNPVPFCQTRRLNQNFSELFHFQRHPVRIFPFGLEVFSVFHQADLSVCLEEWEMGLSLEVFPVVCMVDTVIRDVAEEYNATRNSLYVNPYIFV